MQSKLLRAIQERAVRAVGATAEVHVDVRVISATHKELSAEVQAQRFRQDLFYRLNVIQITLPPLRERLEDLPLLCQHVLERIAQQSGTAAASTLSTDALSALLRHPFPGNVRELENMIHRAVALSNHSTLSPEDLGLPALSRDPVSVSVNALTTSTPTSSTEQAHTATEGAAAPAPRLPSDLVSHLDEVEREILVRALEKHRLNRTAAGASLGLSLRQMRYRMARLGVHVSDQGVTLGERFDPDADVD